MPSSAIDEVWTGHVPRKGGTVWGRAGRRAAPGLRRVFRDDEEIAATPSLKGTIREALVASRFLIVICSPQTPSSTWIKEEIRTFVELGRQDRILLVLLDGEPKDSFPTLDPAETLGGGLLDVLAPDIRAPTLGGSLRLLATDARFRLLARLLGCSFDDLKQREQERRIRQIGAAVAVLAVFVVVLTVFTVILFQQREAERTARQDAARRSFDLQTELAGRYARDGDLAASTALLGAVVHDDDQGLCPSARRFLSYWLPQLTPSRDCVGALRSGTVLTWRDRAYVIDRFRNLRSLEDLDIRSAALLEPENLLVTQEGHAAVVFRSFPGLAELYRTTEFVPEAVRRTPLHGVYLVTGTFPSISVGRLWTTAVFVDIDQHKSETIMAAPMYGGDVSPMTVSDDCARLYVDADSFDGEADSATERSVLIALDASAGATPRWRIEGYDPTSVHPEGIDAFSDRGCARVPVSAVPLDYPREQDWRALWREILERDAPWPRSVSTRVIPEEAPRGGADGDGKRVAVARRPSFEVDGKHFEVDWEGLVEKSPQFADATDYDVRTFGDRVYVGAAWLEGAQHMGAAVVQFDSVGHVERVSDAFYTVGANFLPTGKGTRFLLISSAEALGNPSFFVWDLDRMEEVFVDSMPGGAGPRGGQAAFSSDARRLAIATETGEIWVYERGITRDARIFFGRIAIIHATQPRLTEASDEDGYRVNGILGVTFGGTDLVIAAIAPGLVAWDIATQSVVWSSPSHVLGSNGPPSLVASDRAGTLLLLRGSLVQMFDMLTGIPLTSTNDLAELRGGPTPRGTRGAPNGTHDEEVAILDDGRVLLRLGRTTLERQAPLSAPALRALLPELESRTGMLGSDGRSRLAHLPADLDLGPEPPPQRRSGCVPLFASASFPDLPRLIDESESMDDAERTSWCSMLRSMTDDQIAKLRGILLEERNRRADQSKKANGLPNAPRAEGNHR